MQQEQRYITVSTKINASIEKVWQVWTEPEFIMKWNHASDDWECPSATNDLVVGGEFHYTMSAKDKSVSFDFNGTYTDIIAHEKIAYKIEDGRTVEVTFKQEADGQVLVTETFEAETENPIEMQREGWQAILENFRCVCEMQ